MNINKDINQAISFDKNQKAISFIQEDINSINKFAITKFTNNGSYLKGNMLVYSLNGINIYTEKDNIIFIDLEEKTVVIKKYEEKIKEMESIKNDSEEKEYIIIYCDIDQYGEDLPLKWESYYGRKECYMGILSNVANIDIDKSLVLVDNVPLKDSLSVREFVNYIKNADYIEDDGFDINEYSGSGYI